MYEFMIALAVLAFGVRFLLSLHSPAPRTQSRDSIKRFAAARQERAGLRRAAEYAWSSANVDAKRGAL